LKVTCVSSINPPVENGDSPPCNANPGDQADLKMTLAFADLRCVRNDQGRCSGAGSLYDGKVLTESFLRITDHYNALDPNPPAPDCSDSQSCSGTLPDIPFGIGAQCASGACNYTSSADAVVTGMIQELKRAVVGIGQVVVYDGGLNGNMIGNAPPTTGVCPPACATDDDTLAFVQGLYAP
jgi:hypothetical protein